MNTFLQRNFHAKIIPINHALPYWKNLKTFVFDLDYPEDADAATFSADRGLRPYLEFVLYLWNDMAAMKINLDARCHTSPNSS